MTRPCRSCSRPRTRRRSGASAKRLLRGENAARQRGAAGPGQAENADGAGRAPRRNGSNDVRHDVILSVSAGNAANGNLKMESGAMLPSKQAVDKTRMAPICHCEGASRPWRPEREARGSALGVQSREGTCSPYRPPLKRHAPIASVAALTERLWQLQVLQQ